MKSAILLTIFVLCCILHDSCGREFSVWKKEKKLINDGPNKLSPVIFSELSILYTAFRLFSFCLSFSCFVLHCESFTLLFSLLLYENIQSLIIFFGCYGRDSRMLQLNQLSHADAYNGNWAIYDFVDWIWTLLFNKAPDSCALVRSIPSYVANFFSRFLKNVNELRWVICEYMIRLLAICWANNVCHTYIFFERWNDGAKCCRLSKYHFVVLIAALPMSHLNHINSPVSQHHLYPLFGSNAHQHPFIPCSQLPHSMY